MNKKLLVLAGIMSVLSVNVMAEADMRTTVGGLNNIVVEETENENGQKDYSVGLNEDISGAELAVLPSLLLSMFLLFAFLPTH